MNKEENKTNECEVHGYSCKTCKGVDELDSEIALSSSVHLHAVMASVNKITSIRRNRITNREKLNEKVLELKKLRGVSQESDITVFRSMMAELPIECVDIKKIPDDEIEAYCEMADGYIAFANVFIQHKQEKQEQGK